PTIIQNRLIKALNNGAILIQQPCPVLPALLLVHDIVNQRGFIKVKAAPVPVLKGTAQGLTATVMIMVTGAIKVNSSFLFLFYFKANLPIDPGTLLYQIPLMPGG